jgi:hypothetical protein
VIERVMLLFWCMNLVLRKRDSREGWCQARELNVSAFGF